MSALTFDKAAHRYFVDGRPVLSVTQYLKLAGLIETTWYTEDARARGSAVHTAVFYANQNDLDQSSLHPIIRPYFEGWPRFVSETGFIPIRMEYRVGDPIYKFAGTLDVTGTWNLSPGLILIDIKTGEVQEWAKLQTAAYASCLPEPHRRFGLRLIGDGSYRLTPEYKDINDIKVFRAIVATVNWRIKHGLLVPDEALAA